MSTQPGEATPTLEHLLLNNPDDLPDDPAALDALINGGSAQVDPADSHTDPDPEASAKAQEDEEKKAAETKAAEEAKAKADAEAKAKTEEAQGILAKDGKHVLPMAVLESARKQASEHAERADKEAQARTKAEAAAKEAQDKVADLEAKLKAQAAGEHTDGDAQVDSSAILADLEAVSAGVPELEAPFKALAATIRSMEAKLNSQAEQIKATDEFRVKLEQERQEYTRQQEALLRESVQADIDANPKLSFIQNEKPEVFSEAIKIDNLLIEQARAGNAQLQGLTRSQRFDKALEILELTTGQIDLPEAYQQRQAKGDAKPGDTKDAKTDPNVKGGFKPQEKPITLSNLPGGVAPGTTKTTDEMSNAEVQASVDRLLDRGVTDPLAIMAALESSEG